MNDIDLELLDANKEAHPEVFKAVYESAIEEQIRDVAKISLNDELAILRKTVKYILEVIRELHEGELDIVKFMEHSNAIEAIIARVDKVFEEGNV
jgi:hypothetical protein